MAASLNLPNHQIHQQFHNKSSSIHQFNQTQFSNPINIPSYGHPRSPSFAALRYSHDQSLINTEIPVLTREEAMEKFRLNRGSQESSQEFLAMYSSVFGGITVDPSAMLIPMDDHMVHRGHGVFDTALIMDGHLYELDQHLNRFLKSAKMAKIKLPFDPETIRSILIQTVSVSNCTQGSLRYWLSSGPGDFHLSPSTSSHSALYAVVIQDTSPLNHTGVKVITSSIPIKPPIFATVKSVNYLPNVLCKMEAEEKGYFASIWLDSSGFVAEGPNMNVAFVNTQKELIMPRFENVLKGCTANRVIILARGLLKKGDIRRVVVRDVSVEEGKEAEEMMLVGSGVLVRPVIQWDDQVIGNGKEGPVARALLDAILEDMKSGPTSVCTPVPYQSVSC